MRPEAPSRNGKPDTARARKFIDQFRGWYAAVYGRQHAQADRRSVFVVAAKLRQIDRDKAGTIFAGDSAEEITASALTIAARRKHSIWFLKQDEPLTLQAFVSHWPELWDRLQRTAQEQGRMPSGNGS